MIRTAIPAAFASCLFAIAAPCSAQSVTDVVVMRRAVAAPNPASRTPKVVTVTCKPLLADTGYQSGTRVSLGYATSLAGAATLCEQAATATYTPNLCYVSRISTENRYSTFVFSNGKMGPQGSSPPYDYYGMFSYTYYANTCAPK